MFSARKSTASGSCLRNALAVLIAVVAGSAVAAEGPTSANSRDGTFATENAVVGEPSDYLQDLAQHQFTDAYADGVRLRVFVFPAWSASHAVGIREIDGVFTIFGLQRASRPSLWETALAAWNHRLPELSRQIENRVWRCDARIDGMLAKRITRLAETMLRRSLLEDEVGFDGEAYLVAMPTAGGLLEGRTWSPDAGSKRAQFAQVVYTMGQYCVWNGYRFRRLLEWQIEALESKVLR
jgi:hypothetical protein